MSAVERPTDEPDTELVAAIAWFREDPKRLDFAPITEWSRHLRTIVRAYFARPAAGRDLTATRPADPHPFVVRVGPGEGGQLIGPFATAEAAIDWQAKNVTRPGLRSAIIGLQADIYYGPMTDDERAEMLARPAVARTDGQLPADAPPVYLAADVWSALRLPDAGFAGYYERNGWAETWAVLMAAVRGPGRCGREVDGKPCGLAPHSESTPCYGAGDVGSSEPLPWPAAPADDTAAPDGLVTLPIDELVWVKEWQTRPVASWRCLLAKSTQDEGYASGACRFDHQHDTREAAYADALDHLERWHHLAGQPVRESQDPTPTSGEGGDCA